MGPIKGFEYTPWYLRILGLSKYRRQEVQFHPELHYRWVYYTEREYLQYLIWK